ncbi:MAG: LysR family transcriptional regulator [Rhodanobacter sp.]|jgi:DNA-binding transcriptional LysR family regulator
MLNSDDLAFFEAVSKAQSLADAARKLDVTPSAVTQRLHALEARAGVRLVDRSSRRLTLTDAGVMVIAHGKVVIGAMETLTEALRDRSSIVSGHLRVAAPSGFGRTYIAPIVSEFARLHPKATLTLDLSDHPVARLADSYDVIIHIGSSPPLDATVTTLAVNRRIICASPQYLEGAPPIQSPDDLLAHRCLVLRENAEDVTLWRFVNKRARTTVRIHSAMSTNDGTVLRAWAKAGLGVTIRSEWDVVDDLRLDKLRIVLRGWEPPAANVIAILGPRHCRSARSAAFLTMLRKSFYPPPWRREMGTLMP